MVDIRQLTSEAEADERNASGEAHERASGLHEGLTASGPAQLHPRAGEHEMHHAAYLGGHLMGWIATRSPLDEDLVMVAAGYGAALATPEGQRAVPDPTEIRRIPTGSNPSAIRAHIFAAALVERHRDRRLDEAVERMCFGWLLEQTRTCATPELLAKMKEMRRRRLERTGR